MRIAKATIGDFPIKYQEKRYYIMKKSIKILALTLAVVLLCASLAACGKKLSGKYSADVLGTGTTLTFDGSNVTIAITVTFVGEVASLNATYEIKDDKITFDIADEETVTNELAKKVVAAFEQPQAFAEGENTITIGGVTYTLQAE